MATIRLGSVFVVRVDEIEPPARRARAELRIGDAVQHPAEGPCVVLARIGEHLMVEAGPRMPAASEVRVQAGRSG
jgi:hypothetical protein